MSSISDSRKQQRKDNEPKLQHVDIRWSVSGNDQVSSGFSKSCESTSLMYVGYGWFYQLHISYVCFRKNNMSSIPGSKNSVVALSISSKIQKQMERIIIIIKDMDNSKNEDELRQLNRLLYRATDNLMEFELSLHQLKVSSSFSKSCEST